MMDFVGIGSLNVDYIVSRSKRRDQPGDLKTTFEKGASARLPRRTIIDIINSNIQYCAPYFGGSAFNALQALVAMGADFRLGFVGVRSLREDPLTEGWSSRLTDWFKQNRVDDKFIHPCAEAPQGLCLSWMDGGERDLLIDGGVALYFHELVDQRSDQLIPYLCRAKFIHVSSLFDEVSTRQLAEIVRNVKLANPLVKISVDPGHHWTSNRSGAVRTLYEQADLLFVNQDEMRQLGGYTHGETDETVAERIIGEVAPASVVILQKRYDRVTLFYKLYSNFVKSSFENEPLSDEEIEDATGAGDVFAAGFLAGKLVEGFEIKDCIDLALALVRTKLQAAGTENHKHFRDIFASAIEKSIRRVSTPSVTTLADQQTVVHSEDFTQFRVGRELYSFTPAQAQIVEILYEQWRKRMPDVRDGWLLERAGVSGQTPLRVLFQRNPAWGKLIVPGTHKGSHRLDIPLPNDK